MWTVDMPSFASSSSTKLLTNALVIASWMNGPSSGSWGRSGIPLWSGLLLEQAADPLPPMDAPDRLGEQRRDRDDVDLGRQRDRMVLDGVGDDQRLDRTVVKAVHRLAGKDAVGDCGTN